MRKDFDTEAKEITMKELIEVRKDEMQRILPNHFTMVGDVVVKSKEIKVREGKK